MAAVAEDLELSSRELEVITLLGNGMTYKQIAREMQISVSTVRSHANSIYRKLGVYNAAQAVTKLLTGHVSLKLRRPKQVVEVRRPHGLAETAPLLHAYLVLWEQAGCPVPKLIDLGWDDPPPRRRQAMKVLIAMHLRLDADPPGK